MKHYRRNTLNIEKQKMDTAWINRNANPMAMVELVGYFHQMAEYFARKFGINSYYRDDYISESLDQAQRALKNFKLGKSSTYSYFYKVMSNSFRYSLRRDGRKRAKMPNTCSFDELSNIVSGDYESEIPDPLTLDDSTNQVIFAGQQYMRDDLIALVKEGKVLARKVNKLSSEDAKKQFIDKIETGLLRDCVLGIISRKEERDSKKNPTI